MTTLYQEKLSAKKQGNRIPVFHPVYCVDDTDIPANSCLANRKNN